MNSVQHKRITKGLMANAVVTWWVMFIIAIAVFLTGCSGWWLTGEEYELPTEPLWGEVFVRTADTVYVDTITIVVDNPNR